MTQEHGFEGIGPQLLKWIAGLMAGEVIAAERIPGGASRLSYVVTFAPTAKIRHAFLRVDSGIGPLSDTRFTLAREAAVMSALKDSGVRTPEIFGFSAEHQALLMERIAGSADFFSVNDPAVAESLQNELLSQLAKLHSAPVDIKAVFDAKTSVTIDTAL